MTASSYRRTIVITILNRGMRVSFFRTIVPVAVNVNQLALDTSYVNKRKLKSPHVKGTDNNRMKKKRLLSIVLIYLAYVTFDVWE